MPDTPNQRLQNRDANAAQRAALAVKLRASKVGYEQIARQCGYGNPGTAHRAVMRELQRTVVTNVDELRREECATLDILQQECMTMALDRNYKGRLFAVDRIIAIMERRARLMGMDIPVDDALNQNVVVVREVPAYLGIVEAPTNA
jgi:hypothetical protein